MKGFAERIKVFWDKKDLVKLLVQKDLKLKYRRSFLGYLWSVLNPLFVMIIMTIVFSQLFKSDIENFPVYILTGQLMFNYMTVSVSNAMGSITGNAALLKKIYVPKYIFTFSKITSGLVDLLLSLVALVLVMIFSGARFSWCNLLFILPILELYAFCVGLGMLMATLNVFFRDIEYIWNAVSLAWMYLTPLFYPISMLPDVPQWIVKHLNPMYFYIGQFRDVIHSNTLPGWGIIIEGLVAAIIMCAIGTSVFWKNQDKFILYI